MKTLFFHTLLLLGILSSGCCSVFADNRDTTSHAMETTIHRDTLVVRADSIIVIETACAPICSSIVRIYNKEWRMIGDIPSPFSDAVFPEAFIENNAIHWRDNTGELLDEEEKKAIEQKHILQ